jgi:hypothetical protein
MFSHAAEQEAATRGVHVVYFTTLQHGTVQLCGALYSCAGGVQHQLQPQPVKAIG